MTKFLSHFLLFSFTVLCTACLSSRAGPDDILSINIVDRNGTSETISRKERLESFQKTDFLSPQPYQKVLRVFGRDEKGNSHSCITSYHPNGQIKQYLEAINNRAFGPYKEWHANGILKIEGNVIGGIADINTQAEESYLFDGINRAWDDEGHLLAEIPYQKGELSGEAHYFHSNGTLWKITPFSKNAINGMEKITTTSGALFQTTEYLNGLKEGFSLRYWPSEKIAFKERYNQNKLIEAEYFDIKGEKIAQIVDGQGFRAILGKEGCEELQEFENGVQKGVVKVFSPAGQLMRTYGIIDGEKQGEEIDYYPSTLNPKLLVTWRAGLIQGVVKTWYPNGKQESLKEMSQNKKNGHSTAWYSNGFLMFVEEYENDKLVKGEYYKSGEKIPCSRVERGKGIATLFDAEGTFARKVIYKDGRPAES